MKKRLLTVALSIILVVIPMLALASIPKATDVFYINDFADMLSESEEADMLEKATHFFNEHGIQIVVTTLDSLNGQSIDDCKYNMFVQYGLDANGVLVVIARQERKLGIQTGNNMRTTYISNEKSKTITATYATPLLKQNKFNEGLISLQNGMMNELQAMISASVRPVEQDGKTKEPVHEEQADKPNLTLLWIFLGGVALFAFIVFLVKKNDESYRTDSDDGYSAYRAFGSLGNYSSHGSSTADPSGYDSHRNSGRNYYPFIYSAGLHHSSDHSSDHSYSPSYDSSSYTSYDSGSSTSFDCSSSVDCSTSCDSGSSSDF